MNRLIAALIASLLFWSPAGARQTAPSTANPLIQLYEQVKGALAESKMPFSPEQENAIVLMMEDRRKASEDLFGNLMDFKAGPTQGQADDQARSAIDWLRAEFLKGLQAYLTPEQLGAWSSFQSAALRPAANRSETASPAPVRQQTQYVRLNNNTFTAETDVYEARTSTNAGGAEVIQRGGQGAWHGNGQFFWQSEKLNAGRRFATNKPPYQERQTSFDFSGPLIPGRLTFGINGSQNESKNVDTVRATLGDRSIFARSITKPSVNRSLGTKGTYQISDGNSLTFALDFKTNKTENNGAGGITLPERASTLNGHSYTANVKQFSSLSARSIVETGFTFSRTYSKTVPVTQGLRINVTDAFSSGGAQNDSETTNDVYGFSGLYTRLGEKLTIKTGTEGNWRRNHSITTANFLGTYSFSGLDDFNAGKPTNFRVNRGIPELRLNQLETAFFVQNDLKVTNRLTFMSGVRYEVQTNISDHNNVDLRLGLARSIGRATVIRAGAGIFHQRVATLTIETQLRQNGVTQYEVVVENPLYDPSNPDPANLGSIKNTPPSIRVMDKDLAAPYDAVLMASFERTFFNNLFISVLYDHGKEIHRVHTRNLNAPLDITSAVPASCRPEQDPKIPALGCVRPFPDRGNILNYESTGGEVSNHLRVNYRQRFGIFNASANYLMQYVLADSPTTPTQSVLGLGYTADGMGSDQYNMKVDWGLASFALHTLNTTVNARLPFGIFLTQTSAMTSGKPYSLWTGKDDNHDGNVNDRPPGAKRDDEHGTPQITFGYNLSKAFFFGDAPSGSGGARKNLNLYANISNAFNHANYGPPSGAMTSPNFGRSTTATAPREIEIGVRYQF